MAQCRGIQRHQAAFTTRLNHFPHITINSAIHRPCYRKRCCLHVSHALDPSKAAAFVSWFNRHSVECEGSAQIELRELSDKSGQGYGMIASQDIQQGQYLVCIPKTVMMTATTALSSPTCSAVTSLEGVTPWQALLLHLLCERALGPDSFWRPFLDILPSQESHPLFWTEEQLSWLQASPMQSCLQQRRQQIAEDLETLLLAGAGDLPIAQQYKAAHGIDLITRESLTWAAATVLSRAFNLGVDQDEDGQPYAEEVDLDTVEAEAAARWQAEELPLLSMVPWADMLNHSSEAGQESLLRWDPDLRAAVLSAHRSYTAGQQVFDSYGTLLSPVDLLLDYGYADDANDKHRFDVLGSDVAPPRSERNQRLLKTICELQGGEQPLLALGPTGLDPASLAWLRASVATDVELIRSGWRVLARSGDINAAANAMGRLSEPVSAATELKVLEALDAFIVKQLERYPSSIEQDEEELAWEDTEWVRRQALLALKSEKLALKGCLEVVRGYRRRLADGCPVEELYPPTQEDEEEEYELLGV